MSLGRTCILVEPRRSLFGRKQSHAVHVWAVREIDGESRRISLAVGQPDVVRAPEFRHLDSECEATIARYYYALLTGSSDSPHALV